MTCTNPAWLVTHEIEALSLDAVQLRLNWSDGAAVLQDALTWVNSEELLPTEPMRPSEQGSGTEICSILARDLYPK